MNCSAELVLDFLQRTLGIRGRGHNHHADYFVTFFSARKPSTTGISAFGRTSQVCRPET
jgi:hypothetical protein